VKRQIEDAHIYFPVKVLNAIRKLAAQNRRSVTAEVVIAVEDYIKERYANEPNGRPATGKGKGKHAD
jgi:hypothetical protein